MTHIGGLLAPAVLMMVALLPALGTSAAAQADTTARATTPTFSIPSRMVVTGTPDSSMFNACETSCGVSPSARARS